MQEDFRALQHATDRFRGDAHSMLAVVVVAGGRALQFLSERLQTNKDIVLAAMGRDSRAIQFFTRSLDAMP